MDSQWKEEFYPLLKRILFNKQIYLFLKSILSIGSIFQSQDKAKCLKETIGWNQTTKLLTILGLAK